MVNTLYNIVCELVNKIGLKDPYLIENKLKEYLKRQNINSLTTIISDGSKIRHSLCLLAAPPIRFPKLKEKKKKRCHFCVIFLAILTLEELEKCMSQSM